jgi:hypothetical protein
MYPPRTATHHLSQGPARTACGKPTIARRNIWETEDWQEVTCEACKRTARYKARRALTNLRDAQSWLDARDEQA